MVKTRADMELETGLIDDFDGAIADAYFDVNPEYSAAVGRDIPGLTLVFESPDLEQAAEQWYSAGEAKQWQIGRGGREITSAKNPDSHRFNMNSRVGIIVSRMFTLVGNGDKAKGQDFFLKRDRYMTESEFYAGLNFHWKREPLKTVGGEERNVLMPVAYLGEVSPGKKAATVAEAPTEDLDAVLVKEAIGKTTREVKQVAMKIAEFTDAYKRNVISGTKLADLEKEGKLTLDPDGRYI